MAEEKAFKYHTENETQTEMDETASGLGAEGTPEGSLVSTTPSLPTEKCRSS